jgi:hypothetical protein
MKTYQVTCIVEAEYPEEAQEKFDELVADHLGHGGENKPSDLCDVDEALNAHAREGFFTLSDEDFAKIIDSLDSTGGYLVKESELRYWIEKFVNRDREGGCQ